MKLTADATCRDSHSRCGFTLVELMVVIAIIGVVVTLAASATVQVITRQRAALTEATIQKVNDALKAHVRNIIDQANTEPIPDNILQGLIAMAGGAADPDAARRARIIWIKLRLKQEFPMNFMEALNPTPKSIRPSYVSLPPTPAFAQALQASDAKDPPQNFEASVCLLLALSRASKGAVSFDEDRLASTEKGEAPGMRGLKMILDGWGRPLTFYRWPIPTELTGSNPNKTSRFGDPLDPDGLLMSPGWNNTQAYQKQQGVWAFEKLLHPVHVGSQPVSYYTVPVIASAGPTAGVKQPGQPYAYLDVYDFMGLPRPQESPPPMAGLPTALRHDPMTLTGGTSDSFDNIYSFRMRLGARGD
jgi:prepilin-type N-terminal cleavage/methylation domain-containing protein